MSPLWFPEHSRLLVLPLTSCWQLCLQMAAKSSLRGPGSLARSLCDPLPSWPLPQGWGVVGRVDKGPLFRRGPDLHSLELLRIFAIPAFIRLVLIRQMEITWSGTGGHPGLQACLSTQGGGGQGSPRKGGGGCWPGPDTYVGSYCPYVSCLHPKAAMPS